MDIKKITLLIGFKLLFLFTYGQVQTPYWLQPWGKNTGTKKSMQIGDGVGLDTSYSIGNIISRFGFTAHFANDDSAVFFILTKDSIPLVHVERNEIAIGCANSDAGKLDLLPNEATISLKQGDLRGQAQAFHVGGDTINAELSVFDEGEGDDIVHLTCEAEGTGGVGRMELHIRSVIDSAHVIVQRVTEDSFKINNTPYFTNLSSGGNKMLTWDSTSKEVMQSTEPMTYSVSRTLDSTFIVNSETVLDTLVTGVLGYHINVISVYVSWTCGSSTPYTLIGDIGIAYECSNSISYKVNFIGTNNNAADGNVAPTDLTDCSIFNSDTNLVFKTVGVVSGGSSDNTLHLYVSYQMIPD
jgi:hypothetical protein